MTPDPTITTMATGTATDMVYSAPERCTPEHDEWLARIVRRTGQWPSVEMINRCITGQPWITAEVVADEQLAPVMTDALIAHVGWVIDQIMAADEHLVDEITALTHYTSRPPMLVAPSAATVARRVHAYVRAIRDEGASVGDAPQAITVFTAVTTPGRPATADAAMRDATRRSVALDQAALVRTVVDTSGGAGHHSVVTTRTRVDSALAREARLGSVFAYSESAWSVPLD